MPRTVVQSFKKVINQAPASITAGLQVIPISLGIDNVTVGQTSAIDVNVPTGAVIKYIEIQHALGNLAATACFIHASIQQIHDGQSVVGPDVVGGNPRRNQVFHQALYQVGDAQSNTRVYRFKVPKKFQRVREGDVWQMVWRNSETVSSAAQVIYKFYR